MQSIPKSTLFLYLNDKVCCFEKGRCGMIASFTTIHKRPNDTEINIAIAISLYDLQK